MVAAFFLPARRLPPVLAAVGAPAPAQTRRSGRHQPGELRPFTSTRATGSFRAAGWK
jgi:hypothetical protein